MLIILAVGSIIFQNHSLVFLPPILICLFILAPFVRSVSPDYIPLLTQFYYLTDAKNGNIEPKRVQYTTVLTWIWIILISLMLCETIFLSIYASLETWSLYTNFFNYLILLSFMLLEWFFRNLYFNQWQSPLVFIKQMLLIDHQQLLKKRVSP